MFSYKITRRQFLKWLSASAVALGLSQTDILKMEKRLEAAITDCDPDFPSSLARVIWITGQDCGGCATTILNYLADPADPDPVLNVIAKNKVLKLLDIEAVTTAPGQGADGNIDIAEVVLEIVTIDWGYIVMAASGDVANQHLATLREHGGYVLMIDGAIPINASGKYCQVFSIPGDWSGGIWDSYITVQDPDPTGVALKRTDFTMAGAALWLATNAAAVVCLGTCASWGGIPAAKGSVTGAKSGWEWINKINGMKKVIANIPGCPPHPDWFIHTVGAYILGLLNLDTDLDYKGRPRNTSTAIYSDQFFCRDCTRRDMGMPTTIRGCQKNATNPKGKCLAKVGCNGKNVGSAFLRADCPTRKWNNHTNWCVGNNMPCQGCTDPGFPDRTSPFYKLLKNT